MESPVRKLRKALDISQEALARRIGKHSASVRNYERNLQVVPAEVRAKLTELAMEANRPDLAEEFAQRPPEKSSERNDHWHALLEFVLNSGVDVAIEAVTRNLIAFHLTVTVLHGEERHGLESDAPDTPPDIASRIAELRSLAEQSQAHPELLRPEKRRSPRRPADRRAS